jgi:hypothetical protein
MKGMTNGVQTTTYAINSVQFENFFGPPPVLSTESAEVYKAILSFCSDSVKPKNFIEHLLVRDVVDASWEIRRYVAHKTLMIDRKYRNRIEYLARRAKEVAENPDAIRLRKDAKESLTELDRAYELEFAAEATLHDVTKIIKREPVDLDHARALEEGIEIYEKLDRLLNAAIARRDNALSQLERYRNGLGQHLRRVSDGIIDAEFSEAETDVGQEVTSPSIEGAIK